MSPEEVIVIRKLAKRGNMNDRMDVVLNKFRSRINSYPPGMCPLVMYRSILQMSMNQSCGKCVPCRDPTGPSGLFPGPARLSGCMLILS